MSNITKIGLGVCITGIAAAALGTNPLTLSFLGLIAAGQAITRVSDLGKWCCRRFDSDEDHMRAQVQKLPITLRLIVLPLRLMVKPDGNLPPSISANIPPCSTDGDSTSATSEIAIPNQTQNHTGPDYLSTLPRELCVNIQSFSNDVDRKSMSYTCKRLHEIDDPELADWIADQRWLESKKRVTLAELRERAPGLVSNHSFELVLDNTITDDELLEIGKRFPNISAIDAASRSLTNVSLKHLACLTNLTKLNLCHNNIGGEELLHLVGLPSLKRLLLVGTKITEEGCNAFAAHYLESCRPEFVITESHKQFVSKNRITVRELKELGPDFVSNHSFELKLDFAYTDDELLEIVKRFHNISAIDAASRSLTNVSLKHLASLTNLTRLFLPEGNNLGEEVLRVLPHLTRLSSDCFLDKERTDKTEYAAWIARQISELREMKEGYEKRTLHNEYLAQRLFKDEANLEIHTTP